MIKTITHTLPSYWASALINNDFSGLSEQSKFELSNWLLINNTIGDCLDCDKHNSVGHFDGLICDTLEYTFTDLS